MTGPDESELASFWTAARAAVPTLPEGRPDAWAFGAVDDRRQADALAELVMSGIKTATSSSFWDYESAGEPLPRVGDLSIVLDGSAEPCAVIETTAVTVVAFDAVSADHARAEGEGDLSLEFWRREHQRFWTEHSEDPRGFAPTMPVVCERFAVRYTRPID